MKLLLLAKMLLLIQFVYQVVKKLHYQSHTLPVNMLMNVQLNVVNNTNTLIHKVIYKFVQQTVMLMVRDQIKKTTDVQMVVITMYLPIMIRFVFQLKLKIVQNYIHSKSITKATFHMNVQVHVLNMLQYNLIQIRNYVKLLVLV